MIGTSNLFARSSFRLARYTARRVMSSWKSRLAPWSAPPEPDKPRLPYEPGLTLNIQRIRPPPPFDHIYLPHLTPEYRTFILQNRVVDVDRLRSTTLVDYCLSTVPLPIEPLGETAVLKVDGVIAVGDGRNAQIVTCDIDLPGTDQHRMVAKIYDPLYYSFVSEESPNIPEDVVGLADGDLTTEAAAFECLDAPLGGKVIPRYYGSWTFNLTLRNQKRAVHLILMEQIDGVMLRTLNPDNYSDEDKLRVVAKVMECDALMEYYGVTHTDLYPRNIICSTDDLGSSKLAVRVIDFNSSVIHSLRGLVPRCTTKSLPESPINLFWKNAPDGLREWVPDYLLREAETWRDWLKSRWANSPSFETAVPR
ncbi:hypothetical protein K445DRAFT_313754 [Daldinia sp. EC12]|nr:hypothetical protein K445DRAFT_313754 [Daldinia sp. EC12]